MKQEEHAARAWIILVSAAMNRQTLNYLHLSDRLGPPPNGFASILGHILFFCRANKLPPLTSLVVLKDGGLPGDGFGNLGTIHSDREKVYAHPWHDIPAPRSLELAEAWKQRYRYSD